MPGSSSPTRRDRRAEQSWERAGFVSGRWSLVSGCELADWIPVMCLITEDAKPRLLAPGVPEMRMAYLPKGSYQILDTWYVGGLRGTGSHDVVVDEVFVPAERTFSFTDAHQLDQPLSRMPFFAMLSAGCAAICLGIAQAATDTLLELGSSKVVATSLLALLSIERKNAVFHRFVKHHVLVHRKATERMRTRCAYASDFLSPAS
jgi:alkylation response protein AidB-like acyl-CoA dehydrogenase